MCPEWTARSMLLICSGVPSDTSLEPLQGDRTVAEDIKLIHTSRYRCLEGSTALIGRALRDSVVAIAELELHDVADRSSNNIRDICILRSSNYYRYDLVGPLDFRNNVATYF